MTTRETLLRRVRTAVTAGQSAGRRSAASAWPQRGSVGYQGACSDPVAHFVAECTAAGGQVWAVPHPDAAASKLLELLRAKNARLVLLGTGPVIDSLGLEQSLPAQGFDVHGRLGAQAASNRDVWWRADAGISDVDYLVAETGSLAVVSRPDEPRSLSLLPPVHIVLARRSRILPDLFDLFALLQNAGNEPGPSLPSCLTLVTGPSKTGDIELKLVTGVHGPGEVHVIVIAD